MPKYQIILSSDSQLSDQEFKEWCDKAWFIYAPLSKFILIDARNLEGIRKELWEIREQAIENVCGPDQSTVVQTYDEVVDLFKIGD